MAALFVNKKIGLLMTQLLLKIMQKMLNLYLEPTNKDVRANRGCFLHFFKANRHQYC